MEKTQKTTPGNKKGGINPAAQTPKPTVTPANQKPQATEEQIFGVGVDAARKLNIQGLRDEFAGLALMGILANTDSRPNALTAAVRAYEQADAMLAQREKRQVPS